MRIVRWLKTSVLMLTRGQFNKGCTNLADDVLSSCPVAARIIHY